MNTVKKGDAFENRAFQIVSELIERNSFGFSEYVRVFKKKGYRSEERGTEIIFDIAIEVWTPNAENFSFLYLVECKDYEKPIPVEKMGYFIGNIKQVRAHKGVFISTNGFQSGSVNLARFNRIMLIRAEMEGGHDIVLHRKNLKDSIPLVDPRNELSLDQGTSMIVQIIDNSLLNLFKPSTNAKPLVDDQVAHLSKEEISKLTRDLAEKINPRVKTHAEGITHAMIEAYARKVGLKIVEFDASYENLGFCQPRLKTIGLRKGIPERRKIFVLAHELAHYILHKNLVLDQSRYDSFSDPQINIRTNKFLLSNPRNEIEWQANYFAATLILPDYAAIARLHWYQQEHGISKGILYMDDQPSNMKAFAMIIDKMARNFNTTKTSVQYRLLELNKLKIGSRLKGIGQVIADNYDTLTRNHNI